MFKTATSSHANRRRRIAASAICAAVLSSCTAEDSPDPPFKPQYTTERLRVGTHFDTPLCTGQLDLWEAQIDVVESQLGVFRESVWVDLFDDSEALATACHRGPNYIDSITGCWDDPVINALASSVTHEIVHAWAISANPDPLPLLREGLAERLAGPILQWEGPPYTANDLIQADLPFAEYKNAAHFVGWLMTSYGTNRFMDLYAGTVRGSSMSTLTIAFTSALGAGPEEVLEKYKKALTTVYPGMGSQACGGGAKIPWSADGAVWEAVGSCADGPLLGFGPMPWLRIAVEIPTDGSYILNTNMRPAAMTRCLVLPTGVTDLTSSDFPVADDWDHRQFLDNFSDIYGFGGDEIWMNRVLNLKAGTYDLWIFIDPAEGDTPTAPEMSLRRM